MIISKFLIFGKIKYYPNLQIRMLQIEKKDKILNEAEVFDNTVMETIREKKIMSPLPCYTLGWDTSISLLQPG